MHQEDACNVEEDEADELLSDHTSRQILNSNEPISYNPSISQTNRLNSDLNSQIGVQTSNPQIL